jgi:cobalamin biosynthesis protein CobD/CbiB
MDETRITPKNARRLRLGGLVLLPLGVIALAVAIVLAAQGSGVGWVNIALSAIITVNGLAMSSTARRIEKILRSKRQDLGS